jgi:hypothetical protein
MKTFGILQPEGFAKLLQNLRPLLRAFHFGILFENPPVDFTFSDGRTLQILQDGKVLW